MEMSDDLDPKLVAAALPGRPLRVYPAVLSTEAVAMAWARKGAASGSVVAADYQAAPRGRGGWPWTIRLGEGLGFTLITRPELAPEREGWPYVAVLLALHDVIAHEGSVLDWPDTVLARDGTVVARLAIYVDLGPARAKWVTATVLVEEVTLPRVGLLARLVDAIEYRIGQSPEHVLADYLPLCRTLGRHRRARLIPMGPGGPEVTGEAVDVLADGALVLFTTRGNRVAVPPQNLGVLTDPAEPSEPPEMLFGRPTS